MKQSENVAALAKALVATQGKLQGVAKSSAAGAAVAGAVGTAAAAGTLEVHGQQVAAELNTTGCYSIVRHPLYLGNLLMWLGPAVFVRSLWIVLICLLAFWLYYERIMCAEEDFLETRFGSRFRAWSAATPALFPLFRSWETPRLPFTVRRVLRREYNAFLAIAALFCLLVLWRSWLHGPGLTLPASWMLLLATATLTFLLCLVVKKRTSLLEVTRDQGCQTGGRED